MAFLKINDVKICGMSACVPRQVDENRESSLFDDKSLNDFLNTTGIERKRRAPDNVCTSDLCVAAADRLIESLNWDRKDISIIVFVTQTPDYILPATSPIIQQRLGLGNECYALDVSLGCSGWVYGLSVVASLLKCLVGMSPEGDKALLLAGDTILKFCSGQDKSTYPLFGDAGTATALEYCPGANPCLFNMGSDGEGFQAIVIQDGGLRNPFSLSSLNKVTRDEGITSNNLQLVLDGMEVFSFGIKRAPESVNALINEFKLNKDQIDYFIFHQANYLMNEKIRKKLQLPPEKTPYSLRDFGNTSSATIPLTMVTQLRNILIGKRLSHIASGFGVGLSWGSVHFTTDHINCPELVEI
jgi:3-oxoacyl-[acyl-carrier-protein] synthase-3